MMLNDNDIEQLIIEKAKAVAQAIAYLEMYTIDPKGDEICQAIAIYAKYGDFDVDIDVNEGSLQPGGWLDTYSSFPPPEIIVFVKQPAGQKEL